MNILLLGGAGFIGTNLVIELAKNLSNNITVVDINESYFDNLKQLNLKNVKTIVSAFDSKTNYCNLLKGFDIVYHLISKSIPTTSSLDFTTEFDNISISVAILDACVKENIKKIIFISSGGTVYGKEVEYPIKEENPTNPICSYGLQKLVIEKLIYLCNHNFGIDYNIIRLANPYGPYQRPNGKLGAITTFTYKTIKDESIILFGDGGVVRDYIYIKDAIKAIINISFNKTQHKIYNIGTGVGISLNEVLKIISSVLNKPINIDYKKSRNVDVPISILDISRYQKEFGKLANTSFADGIQLTANYLKTIYYIVLLFYQLQ